MRRHVGIRLFAIIALLGLAACPGRSDQQVDGGYDPSSGNEFDMRLQISDQRAQELDPSTLPSTPTPCMPPRLGVVTGLSDGDTIHVVPVDSEDGAFIRVRMIGVDTPEVVHGDGGRPPGLCGREAFGFTELLRGHYVWLTYDAGCTDDFGRDLAYVWIGAGDSGEGGMSSDMWNRQLVRRGFATTLSIAPNESYASTFEADRGAAEAEGLGLWNPSNCLPLP